MEVTRRIDCLFVISFQFLVIKCSGRTSELRFRPSGDMYGIVEPTNKIQDRNINLGVIH